MHLLGEEVGGINDACAKQRMAAPRHGVIRKSHHCIHDSVTKVTGPQTGLLSLPFPQILDASLLLDVFQKVLFGMRCQGPVFENSY